MTDERFERDLTALLRDASGGEAPASLRARVAIVLAEAPATRRPWFGGALQLSLVAVAVVAILAAAIFVSQRPQVGPPPSGSLEPTPTTETSPSSTTGTPTPLPSASVVAPSPNSTTSTPTQVPGAGWTGLSWSDGVTAPQTDTGSIVVNDVVAWGSGFVGAGYENVHDPVTDTDLGVAPAFLTSPDGRQWTVSQLGEPVVVESQGGVGTLIATRDGLIAIGVSDPHSMVAPLLWRSTDGRSWALVDSPTWRAAWAAGSDGIRLRAAAGGPAGIVAIGGPHADWGDPKSLPVIAYSADGVTWSRIAVTSAFDSAYLYDATTYAGGFVIVGRTGQPDPPEGTGFGRPAAWVSTDGRTWRKANVPGDAGPRGTLTDGGLGPDVQLSEVVAGGDGLFAAGWRAGGARLNVVDPTSAWASSDGLAWRFVGDLGTQLPYIGALAGDGSHMVLFGQQSTESAALTGWSSTDGMTWTRLAFSGSTSLPTLPRGSPVHVMSYGLVVAGFRPDAPGEQLWFATATGP